MILYQLRPIPMLLPTPRSIVCIPTYILIATHFDVVAYIGRKVLHFRSKKKSAKYLVQALIHIPTRKFSLYVSRRIISWIRF